MMAEGSTFDDSGIREDKTTLASGVTGMRHHASGSQKGIGPPRLDQLIPLSHLNQIKTRWHLLSIE